MIMIWILVLDIYRYIQYDFPIKWCSAQVHCGHLLVWGDVKRGRDISHRGRDNAGVKYQSNGDWSIEDISHRGETNFLKVKA